MARTGYVPSKNLVVAREGQGAMPGYLRPGNQARMFRSASANPSVADDRDQLAGMGVVLSGNGLGDNGLSSPAQLRRLARRVDHLHVAQRARLGQLADAGSPNASPVSTRTDLTFHQAMRNMPGSTPTGQQSQVVDRIRRDLTDSWEISTFWDGATRIYTAQLVRTTPTGQHMILLTSDDLATEEDARSYIRAHEFARQATQGKPPRILFNARLSAANGGQAAVKQSQVVPFVASPSSPFPGMYQPGGNVTNVTANEAQKLSVDGLGALTDPSMLGLIAVGVGAFLFLRRKKRS